MRILRLVWLVPATVALVAAAALVPQLSDDEPAAGEAYVEVEGLARVTRADGGPVERVREDTELRRGDRLTMVEGRAVLELSAGVDYEARATADPKASTALTMGTVPVLHAGELLVTAEDDASLEAAGTRVQLESSDGLAALRLSRSLAVGVEVYDGVADVDSAGKRGLVPAFRQLEVPAFGEVPQQAEPLAFAQDDDWDRRFLRPAIALDQRLQGLLHDLRHLRRDGDLPVSFLRSVLPTRPDTSVLAPLVETREDKGDTLVGATITDLSSEGSSFASTWSRVFEFHDEGATWGSWPSTGPSPTSDSPRWSTTPCRATRSS